MATFDLRFAAAAFGLLVLTSTAFGQATVVPTDLQLPGTQPPDMGSLETVSKCDNCHGGYDIAVEPDRNWRGSMMAQATRDPLYWATVAVAEQDFSGAGDLCLRCHTPDGWGGDRSTPTDGSALGSNDADGVSCDSCHRMTNPDQSEWLGVQSPPFIANDGGSPAAGYYGNGMFVLWPSNNHKFGPYIDADANHNFDQSFFHRSAEFCGTCHDVSNPAVGDLAPNHGAQIPLEPGTYSGVPGAPVETKAAFNNFPYAYGVVERTFSEHQASAFATMSISEYTSLPAELQAGSIERAYDAAMASTLTGDYVDGTPRLFTCQTCHLPPVLGPGCNKNGAPVRADLPHHDMTGGNTWVPAAIEYLDGEGKLVVGGNLDATQLAALQAGADRAEVNLGLSAGLSVDGDVLTIVNLTGHKLLSGYPEGRRMWVNIKWYAGDTLLREDGEYGSLAVDLDDVPPSIDTLLDLDGTNTRIYEAHYGMTQEWAAGLVALGWSPTLPLAYDRVTGDVDVTLGDLASASPGSHAETFRFVLNNEVVADNRLPPYGFDYDEAAIRNALPVPADQYGDPGPGGVYEHFDQLVLNPPPGATNAEIDLLYQTTSWEYVQFLYLANTGAVAFLADTGEDLLEAWLATGMSEPVVMASTTWAAGADPWTDLENGLAGTAGIPLLQGSGTLQPGSPVTISLTGARPNATANLVVGWQAINLPFYCGTLVPAFASPNGLFVVLVTDGSGELIIPGTWPAGVPTGFMIYLQYWIVDPASVCGLAASNAVAGTAP